MEYSRYKVRVLVGDTLLDPSAGKIMKGLFAEVDRTQGPSKDASTQVGGWPTAAAG